MENTTGKSDLFEIEISLSSDVVELYNKDIESSFFFEHAKTQIENNLMNLKTIRDDLQKMIEKAASLETNLIMKIDSSTWKDVSALIGLSSTTMINDCINILDDENANFKKEKH